MQGTSDCSYIHFFYYKGKKNTQEQQKKQTPSSPPPKKKYIQTTFLYLLDRQISLTAEPGM